MNKKLFLLTMIMVIIVVCILTSVENFRQTYECLEMKVSMIFRSEDVLLWENMKNGAKDCAKENGVNIEFLYPSGDDAVESQKALLKKAEDSDAIILSAADNLGVYEEVKNISKDIPVIGMESPVINSGQSANVLFEDKSMGEEIAKQIIDDHKPQQVQIISGSGNCFHISEREKAATLALENAGFTVKKSKGTSTSDKGIVLVSDFLVFDKIYNEQKYNKDTFIYCIGVNNRVIDNLERGRVSAISLSSDYNMGWFSVKSAVDTKRTKSILKNKLKHYTITKKNMYEKENQRILYPITQN